MKIAIVAVGEMGAAVGARLREHGASVFTSLAGRGAASRRRAQDAGFVVIDDDHGLVGAVDLVLSIVPPARAADLARRFAPALAACAGRVPYADCNAVAPETTLAIAATIGGSGAPFVDVGIVGPPPRPGDAGPRFYASGPDLARIGALKAFGLDVREIPGGIGQASALKLSYASLTKGLTALGATMVLAATEAGVDAALRDELAASQPGLLAWLARQLPQAQPKARRWVGEMEEIARFLPDPAGGQMFTGAAGVYADIADALEQDGEAIRRLARWAARS